MTFIPERTDEFISVFNDSKGHIRNFPGCNHLELFRDKNDPSVFMTYSFWNSESDLENYRHSELFQSTWAKTKILFAARAEAWTVESLYELS